MPATQFNRQVTAARSEKSLSTMIVVAVANVTDPEQAVGIVRRFSAEDLLELFVELDSPDSDSALVGIQLVTPPHLNGSIQWIAEAVVDFGKVRLRTANDLLRHTYAYRLISGAIFTDGERIEPSNVLEWSSIYEVCTADEAEELELLAHQTWLSTVITRIVNAINPTDEARGLAE